MGEVFEQYTVASWQVGKLDSVSFPVTAIEESGGNRIVPQERPGRDGGKLDDTGGQPRQWNITAVFGTSFEEPGITEGLYPGVIRALIRSFDEHETGTLTLPTVGDVRARAATYKRRESTDADDYATLELTFTQDNEESLAGAMLLPPQVVSTINRLAEQTVFSAQSQGIWNEDLKSLPEIAAEIEGLLLAPGRSVSDLGAVVRSHRRAVQRMIDALESASSTDGVFGDPSASELHRQLRIVLDREAGAEDERSSSRPRAVPFVIDVEITSIFEVAGRLNQDVEALMELNSARIDDPLTLTRGQVIRVFERASA